MNTTRIACVASIVCLFGATGQVEAQTFLKKLGQELAQQLNPPERNPTPAVPPPPDDNLPPPRDRDTVPTNSLSRASLGVRVGPLTQDEIRDRQLIVSRGAVITAIEKGSAADRAGLPLGAVIVAVDGRRVDSPADLAKSVQASRPGQDIELTYYDQNKLARKKVHLAAVATDGVVAIPNPAPIPPPVANPPLANQPAANPPTANPSASSLERELGGGGTRPLLGKIGRVIDGIAAPPSPVNPVPEPAVSERVDPDSELALLRQQLLELTKQVEALRKQVTALEQKVSAKK